MQRINRPHPTTAHRRQRGITLIESLVALVISVLGIIGILGMQMRTLVDSQTATRRAQAVRLIEDFSERLRVQPNALVSLGNYIDLLSDDIVSDFDDKPTPSNDCTNSNSPCTPAALFTRDLGVWKQNVANTLPLGQASIFVAPWDAGSTTASQIGIMVSWRANEAEGLDTDDIDATQVRAADGTFSAGTDTDVAVCPDGRICHLQYITVAARCVRSQNDSKIYCPGSK